MSRIWFKLMIFLICLIFLSCQSGEVDKTGHTANLNKETTLEIDVFKTPETSFFDIFDSVEVVKLEISPKSVIKEVSRIIPYMNEIFILDEPQSAVLRFDNNGKFLSRIQQIGKGPGEYSLLCDFNINPFSKNLELLNPRGELLIYSPEGEFISSIAIPLRASHKFAILTEDLIIFYSMYESKKLFYFSRKENKFLKEEFEFPETLLNTPLISETSPFQWVDSNMLCFFQGFTNNIYNV